ncbi:MAG: porin [Ketobacter sp.]|nr:porin [Ketobacter sp.]
MYGIQFRSQLDDGLSVTGQVVGRGSEDFDAKVNWAYFSYQLTDELTVHAGRQRIPFFLYSDFLDVGYAYTWISPPDEVYGLSGFDNMEGVKLEHYTDIADWTSRLSFLYGASSATLDNEGTALNIDSEDFWDLTWSLNKDWFTIQLTYSESQTTLDAFDLPASTINAILTGANPALALTQEELNYLTTNNDKSTFMGLGVAGDWGNIFAAAEYTDINLDDSPTATDRKSYYVMAGYRMGKTTMALTVAGQEAPNNEDALAILDDPTNSAVLAGAVAANPLVAEVIGAYRGGYERTSYSLTARYDFHPSAAFKAEYTTAEYEYDPGNAAKTTVEPSLIRMGVDLVF